MHDVQADPASSSGASSPRGDPAPAPALADSLRRLWIVILNFNVAEHCLRQVDALLGDHDTGIIVVDNASGAADFAQLEQGLARSARERRVALAVIGPDAPSGTLERSLRTGAGLVLLRNGTNLGYGAGNNSALRALRPVVGPEAAYLIINPDLVISRETARGLLHDGAEIAGPAIFEGYMQAINTHGHAIDFSTGFVDERLRTPGRVGMLHGCCMKLSGRALDKYGLLPEDNFMYGEEIRYFERVDRLGGAPAYLPHLRVDHLGKGSMPKLSESYFYYVLRNHLTYFLETAGPRSKRYAKYTLLFVTWWWGVLTPQIRKKNWPAVRGIFRGTWHGLKRVKGPMPS